MKLHPLGDHVIVKPAAEDKMTKSGIVLPDTSENEKGLKKGEVVAVGQGKILENGNLSPMRVKVGDVVLMKKYGPEEVTIDGTEYLLVEETDIVATE